MQKETPVRSSGAHVRVGRLATSSQSPQANGGVAMRTRAYMFFASRDLPAFDLAMFGVIRRWCLIGRFYA